MKYVPIYILFIGLFLASCQPDTNCRTEDNIRFRSQLVIDSIVFDTLAGQFDTVRLTNPLKLKVKGIGSDSSLYSGSEAVSKLALPLRANTTFSEFSLSRQGRTDTIRIYHQNTNQFVSLACGCFVFHTIDSVSFTRHGIYRVEMLNSTVENNLEDNAIIYMCLR